MKKFLSFLLAFVMLFSLTMPAMAAEVTGGTTGDVTASYTPSVVEAKWGTSADSLTESGTFAAALAAAAAADSTVAYIQLQSDVTTESDNLIQSGVFTLDLNGKTLSSNDNTIHVINERTVVTLTDSASGGKVTTSSETIPAVVVSISGKVVINGGSYSGFTAVEVGENSVCEINGGTFTSTSSNVPVVNTQSNSVLTINGGTFSSGAWAAVSTNGTTNITGGTFNAGIMGHFAYWNGKLDLSGYNASGLTMYQWTNADLTVSNENIVLPAGSTFKDDSGNAVTTLVSGTIYTIGMETTSEPTYTVTVLATPLENGTVTADKTAAAEGETVTVTFTPNEGYVLFDQYAYDPNNTTEYVQLTPGTDANAYTFTMPAHNVHITGEFVKDGKARTDLYFNNGGNTAWTNVSANFYTDTGKFIDTVSLTMVEDGVYTLPEGTEIPNLTYKVYFGNNMDCTASVDIPTGEENMFTLGTITDEYGQYEGTWSVYTSSQPPAAVTSAEISWGSMSFTYTDEAAKWSADTSEGAGTVTVKNTGDNDFTAAAVYTPETDYAEITGSLGDAKTLAAAESGTFTLTLTGKPNKAIPAGTKIGSVTITINEAAEG